MGNGNGQRTQLAETTTTKTKRLEGGSKHQAKQTANRAADQVHQVKSEDPVKKQAKSQELPRATEPLPTSRTSHFFPREEETKRPAEPRGHGASARHSR
jgi:hypothetical protein